MISEKRPTSISGTTIYVHLAHQYLTKLRLHFLRYLWHSDDRSKNGGWVTPWISEIATAWPPVCTMSRVSTEQCVASTLFLTLEQVSGRIKSHSVYRSIAMLTWKFFARTFCIPTGSCFSIAARKNRRGSSRLRGIQYRVSIVLA